MNTLNKKTTVFRPSFEGMSIPWREGSQKKLAVLMSGGVDSSVTALLMRRRGFDVAGVTMDLFGGGGSAIRSAAEVCRALSIPHFSADISGTFRQLVISPFRASYRKGETPNPCAACNERIKFGAVIDLMEQAWGDGFGVATGHYARILREGGKAFLARAVYEKKDQSYFLSSISGELLNRLHFPLGWLSGKDEVRETAREAALPAAETPESMEICFADDYRKIIGGGNKPGPIINTRGRVLGAHRGLTGYTLGQRKGLGIASPSPLFVVDIRVSDNTLVVAPRCEAFKKTVKANCLNTLIEEELREGNVLYGKIRSQGEPLECGVVRIDGGGASVEVEFAEAVFAPAPGQRLALYTSGGLVAAGGVITRG